MEVLTARSGHPIVAVGGRLLASRVDPVKEAETWVQAHGEALSGRGTAVVIGLGCGYHVLALRRRYPHKKVVVLESNADFIAFFQRHHSLDAAGVNFVPVGSLEALENSPTVRGFLAKPYRVVSHEPSLQAGPSILREIHEHLTARTDLGFEMLRRARPNWNRGFAEPRLNLRRDGALSIKDLDKSVKPEERRLYLAIKALRELVR